jgi:hypothetical protein
MGGFWRCPELVEGDEQDFFLVLFFKSRSSS